MYVEALIHFVVLLVSSVQFKLAACHETIIPAAIMGNGNHSEMRTGGAVCPMSLWDAHSVFIQAGRTKWRGKTRSYFPISSVNKAADIGYCKPND